MAEPLKVTFQIDLGDLTDETLAVLADLDKRATPAPWTAEQATDTAVEIGAETPRGHLSVAWLHGLKSMTAEERESTFADAHLIAKLRTHAKDLLALGQINVKLKASLKDSDVSSWRHTLARTKAEISTQQALVIAEAAVKENERLREAIGVELAAMARIEERSAPIIHDPHNPQDVLSQARARLTKVLEVPRGR